MVDGSPALVRCSFNGSTQQAAYTPLGLSRNPSLANSCFQLFNYHGDSIARDRGAGGVVECALKGRLGKQPLGQGRSFDADKHTVRSLGWNKFARGAEMRRRSYWLGAREWGVNSLTISR